MTDQSMTNIALARPFTHLNVYSHFTLLGATPSIGDLAAQAVADGMTHLALTDTNVLYGAVSLRRICRRYGLQPILGMTITVALPDDIQPPDHDGPGRLVLLAADQEGYRSLCALSSAIQGRADRETIASKGIDWELLKRYRQGLICLSGGRRGWIERFLRKGQQAQASRYAGRLGGIYGEHAYLALEIHTPADEPVAVAIRDLGERFGMASVAVQPVYCLHAHEVPRLRVLAAIDHNCTIDTLPTAALPNGGSAEVDLHWLSPAEVAQRFARFPDALAQTAEIAALCTRNGDVLPDGKPIWPVLDLPDGKSHDEALAAAAEAGLAARYSNPSPAIVARLHQELQIIAQMGYAPLFLLVADIVRFAAERDIPYSTRGSVANSLVAYCTAITTVDPIEHDLLFERFLNPERADPPDIDLDFCSRRRDEVLEYVRTRYGADRVALVSTVATMRPRSAVREVAKVMGLPEETVNRLAEMVRDDWHPDPRRRRRDSVESLLAVLVDEQERAAVQTAYELVGTPHHLSVHPGGIVVTPTPVTDFTPVQLAPKGFLITQFDHNDVEAIGLPKIDLLGIRALTVLADTAALVQKHHVPDFRLNAIPAGDAATGELLARGETVGVFQCESAGAQRTLRQLRARSVADLAVANAFFKPGPATGGMAASFVRRYRGEETATYLHPALEPILCSTQGVLLFQEQILRVARQIAGLSWTQADRLRRGMSKFKPDEMEAIEAAFLNGCMRPPPDGPGLDPQQATTLWHQIQAFAGYGFNQGHATAYADLSYRSAYLKAHWPAEFLCARLADSGGFYHQAIYIAEARRLGIQVRPPHINHSRHHFTLAYEPSEEPSGAAPDTSSNQPVLWMGLNQVRDLRHTTIQEIIAARRTQPFRDLRDLCARVSMQRKELIHLIQCGALDGLAPARAALLDEAGQAQRPQALYQMAFNFAATEVVAESANQRLLWEQRILGLPVSLHPLDLVSLPTTVTPLRQFASSPVREYGREVTTAGVRLPGWTGGKGWFLGDRDSYITAILNKGIANPRPWRPILVRGRWRQDEWGIEWLQVEAWEELKPNAPAQSE